MVTVPHEYADPDRVEADLVAGAWCASRRKP